MIVDLDREEAVYLLAGLIMMEDVTTESRAGRLIGLDTERGRLKMIRSARNKILAGITKATESP